MTPTKHLFPELWNNGVDDEGEEEEDLGDDEECWSESGGDDLKHSLIIVSSDASSADLGDDSAELVTMRHLLQTILTCDHSVVTYDQPCSAHSPVPGIIIHCHIAVFQVIMDHQQIILSDVIMGGQGRLETVLRCEDTVTSVRVEDSVLGTTERDTHMIRALGPRILTTEHSCSGVETPGVIALSSAGHKQLTLIRQDQELFSALL